MFQIMNPNIEWNKCKLKYHDVQIIMVLYG